MAGGATAGILAGLMGGWDEQNRVNRRNDTYDYRKARRAVEDAQHDQMFGAQMTGREQQNTLGAIKVENAPTMAQQRLDLGAANVDAAQSNATIAGQDATAHPGVLSRQKKLGHARIQSTKTRNRAAKLGIKAKRNRMGDATTKRQHRKNQQAIADAVTAYYTSHDLGPLIKSYNDTVGKSTGVTVEGVHAMPDGTIAVKFSSGNVRQFENGDELAKTAMLSAHPDIIAAQLSGAGDQQLPGKTATERLAGIVMRNNGWSARDNKQVNAAYKRAQEILTSPADISSKAVSIAMDSPMFRYKSPQEKQSDVNDIIGLLQSAMSGWAVSPTSRVPAPSPAPSARAIASDESANPTATHGAPVATATDTKGVYGPKGGKVVRYADGTVLPAGN